MCVCIFVYIHIWKADFGKLRYILFSLNDMTNILIVTYIVVPWCLHNNLIPATARKWIVVYEMPFLAKNNNYNFKDYFNEKWEEHLRFLVNYFKN